MTSDLTLHLNNCTTHPHGEYRRSKFGEKDDDFVSVHNESGALVCIQGEVSIKTGEYVDVESDVVWAELRDGILKINS